MRNMRAAKSALSSTWIAERIYDDIIYSGFRPLRCLFEKLRLHFLALLRKALRVFISVYIRSQDWHQSWDLIYTDMWRQSKRKSLTLYHSNYSGFRKFRTNVVFRKCLVLGIYIHIYMCVCVCVCVYSYQHIPGAERGLYRSLTVEFSEGWPWWRQSRFISRRTSLQRLNCTSQAVYLLYYIHTQTHTQHTHARLISRWTSRGGDCHCKRGGWQHKG